MRHLCLLFTLGACLALSSFGAATAAPPQPDSAAAQNALVLSVSTSGMQRVTGATLAAAGLDLAQLDPARIWLRHAGQPVPIELRDGGDGRLDPSDELRFYAPPPGDRWNATASYWLSVEATPAPKMPVRSVTPGSAPERSVARERGVAYTPVRYDSRRPGPDGDRWFVADLRAEPGATDSYSLTLRPLLPPAAGTTTLTLTGELYAGETARLTLSTPAPGESVMWSDQGLWSTALSLPEPATVVTITVQAFTAPTAVLLDQIQWERPAQLTLGGRGARFSGVEERWRYTLSQVPSDWSLYDVTEPDKPYLLNGLGTGLSFEDGPAADRLTPRDYLVSGPDTLYEPALVHWQATDLTKPRAATVVYIVPEALRTALEPLVAHRQRQGHSVAVVSIEAIYAAWSHGAVDPEAIRSFLRYAAATWNPHPSTAILVGDGTSDPHDWTARGPNNLNLIPPYLAVVDPWLGEAACDTCYGRLASDDPRTEALPDLMIGRLPVKSAAELERLVQKLIAYETSPANAAWRNTLALIADDPDTAGNFYLAADATAALQPSGVRIRRIYYDPTGARGPTSAATASEQTRAAFAAGAAVLAYYGHSHQWQWALTDATADRSSLLSLYDPDNLNNVGRLPVVLAMTCLSSAFQTPALSGTTIDERLVLAPGGAAAVWGPAGFGVAHGHDFLQRGFFQALWAAPGAQATLGELTMAGYRALAASGGASDSLFTYTLLGDPLTPLHINSIQTVMLPLVVR